VALAFWLRSVWALVFGQIATSLLRVGLSYVIVPGRPQFAFDRKVAGELFRYGRFITGLTIVVFTITEIDNLVVGKLLGFEWLGLYTMAYALANIPATHISKVAAAVIFPAYSSLQGNYQKMRVAFLTVLRFVGGIAIPAAVGLAVLAPQIVPIVYGQKWTPMITALQILALFGGARAIGVVGGSMYNAIGKPNVSFYLSGANLLAILVFIVPATQRYGIEGSAFAVAIPQIVTNGLGLLIIQWELQLPFLATLRILGRIVVASAIMAGAVVIVRRWLGPISLIDLLILVLTGMATYALVSVAELRSLYHDHLKRGLAPSSVPAAI
jgi:PST family polysaccharide transporter/lipopolysaccharide exporter